MNHCRRFLEETAEIASLIKTDEIDALVHELVVLRERRERLFILGLGGSAANASHAVNDFRKLCGIETYCPSDNIFELTARANDEGWDTVFRAWLGVSGLRESDALLIFSVGGGTDRVSACIKEAVDAAMDAHARVLGVVGRKDGAVMQPRRGYAVVVAGIEGPLLTPVTETLQIAVLHALVSDPRLKVGQTKW